MRWSDESYRHRMSSLVISQPCTIAVVCSVQVHVCVFFVLTLQVVCACVCFCMYGENVPARLKVRFLNVLSTLSIKISIWLVIYAYEALIHVQLSSVPIFSLVSQIKLNGEREKVDR